MKPICTEYNDNARGEIILQTVEDCIIMSLLIMWKCSVSYMTDCQRVWSRCVELLCSV